MFPKYYFKYELLPFIREYKLMLFVFVLSIMLTFAFLTLIIPILYSNLSININKLPLYSDLGLKLSSVQNYFILFFIVFLFFLFFSKIRNFIESKIMYLYILSTRRKFIKKIIDKYKIDYKDQNISILVPKIIEITFEGTKFINSSIILLQNVIGLFFIILGTLYFNSKIGLLICLYLIVFFLLCFFRYKNTIPYSIKTKKKFYETTDTLGDDLSNLINTYINNNEKELLNKQNKILNNYIDHGLKESKVQGKTLNLILIFQAIFFVIFFYVIFRLYKKQNISDKILLTLLLLVIYSLNMTYDINNVLFDITISSSPLLESEMFVKHLFEDKYKDGNLKNKIIGNIEFKNVDFKYKGTQNYVIQNLSLKVKNGERLGILGKSGSGKSTIMKLLIKLYTINKGQILIDNNDINNINVSHLRNNIIYVNQNTHLYNNTILYNIQYISYG